MKDYKKILEGVVNIIRTTEKTDIGFAHICSYLSDNCDELFESEDERIRKELIDAIQGLWDNDALPLPLTAKRKDEWIAWLEKKSEQDAMETQSEEFDDNIITHDDEILQAISIGLTDIIEDFGWSDFGGLPIEEIQSWLEMQDEQKPILYKNDISHIDSLLKRLEGLCRNEFERTRYAISEDEEWLKSLKKKIFTLFSKFEQCKQEEPKFKGGDWIVWQDKCYKVNYNGCGYELVDQNGFSTSLEYGTIDENAHIWDITKDAKDGDVLVSQYNNPFIYNGNSNSFHIGSYCGISAEDKFKVATEKCHWTENVNIYPSTKEQCDLLFQKMKEAGYEWNTESKELKNVIIKPKFHIGDCIA